MEIRAFFPCEQVVVRLDGSMDILRYGIDRINLNGPPPGMMIAIPLTVFLHIQFSAAESGDCPISLVLLSPDGQQVAELTTNIKIPDATNGMDKGIRNISVMNISPKTSGEHALILKIRQEERARWPIMINLIPQAWGQPGN